MLYDLVTAGTIILSQKTRHSLSQALAANQSTLVVSLIELCREPNCDVAQPNISGFAFHAAAGQVYVGMDHICLETTLCSSGNVD